MKKTDEGKEAEFIDDTFPDDMQEDVSDINDDKNENNYEEKEAEFIYYNFPDEMQEGVYDINNNKNEKYDEKKMRVKQQIMIAPQWMKVKEWLIKEVESNLIYINFMHPLFQVTDIMIFLIKRKKSLQKVKLFG